MTYNKITSKQLNGGVPERLIGAVLKTVVRSRVPWVRIPPPPPFKATYQGGFFSGFWAYKCILLSSLVGSYN